MRNNSLKIDFDLVMDKPFMVSCHSPEEVKNLINSFKQSFPDCEKKLDIEKFKRSFEYHKARAPEESYSIEIFFIKGTWHCLDYEGMKIIRNTDNYSIMTFEEILNTMRENDNSFELDLIIKRLDTIIKLLEQK